MQPTFEVRDRFALALSARAASPANPVVAKVPFVPMNVHRNFRAVKAGLHRGELFPKVVAGAEESAESRHSFTLPPTDRPGRLHVRSRSCPSRSTSHREISPGTRC